MADSTAFLGAQEFEAVMQYHLNVSEEEAQAIIADGFDEVAQVRCSGDVCTVQARLLTPPALFGCEQGCLDAFQKGTLPSGNEENFAEVWKNWVKVCISDPHAKLLRILTLRVLGRSLGRPQIGRASVCSTRSGLHSLAE
jgi:hypothetical protein